MPEVSKLVISRADKIVMLGDSLTHANYQYWKYLKASVDASFNPGTKPTWTNSGVLGARLASVFLGNEATYVTAFSPTILIIQIGINDENLPTTTPTFISQLTTFTNACVAANPGLRIVLVSTWLRGTTRPSGSNSDDVIIDAYVAAEAALAASKGWPFVDVRTPYFAHVEQVPTGDGVHPNDIGCWWMSSLVLANVTVQL